VTATPSGAQSGSAVHRVTDRGSGGTIFVYALVCLALLGLQYSLGFVNAMRYTAPALVALAVLMFTPAGLVVARVIDTLNTAIGRWVAWLVLVAVVISAGNAIVRKAFDMSSNAWLEAQWVLFGAVFLFCAPWTLLSNEHIRIDIVSNLLPTGVRRGIEVAGHLLFLMPMTIVMMITAWPFFLASFRINEQSLNAGGLPQWPSKLLVPLGFTLLFLQAISELCKRVAMNRGTIHDPLLDAGGHLAAAEAEAARLKAIAEAEAARHGVKTG
jgi:TRAP-type mannitol/chloroaromatic compound transport system permease small subunit